MGVLDAPMGAVAQTLLSMFGRSATLVPVGSGGAYLPTTGNVEGAASPTSISCSVVFEEFTASQIDGTNIKAGDRKAIVSRLALGVEPVAGSHKLVEGGRTWQVLSVEGYSSGEQEAAYALHVRR